jgi:hypothetical protein
MFSAPECLLALVVGTFALLNANNDQCAEPGPGGPEPHLFLLPEPKPHQYVQQYVQHKPRESKRSWSRSRIILLSRIRIQRNIKMMQFRNTNYYMIGSELGVD